MSISVNLYYRGENGAALKFMREMEESGLADEIRAKDGNLAYRYFQPFDDPETVLLIDEWRDQAALDTHHQSPLMARIAALRDKYDVHTVARRFVSEDAPDDEKYLRK